MGSSSISSSKRSLRNRGRRCSRRSNSTRKCRDSTPRRARRRRWAAKSDEERTELCCVVQGSISKEQSDTFLAILSETIVELMSFLLYALKNVDLTHPSWCRSCANLILYPFTV